MMEQAYHRLMECLDYTHAEDVHQIQKQIRMLTDSRKMSPEEATMYPNCRYSCVCGFKTWTAYENSSRTKRTLSRTANLSLHRR